MVGATRRAAGSRERAQGRPVGVKSGERISIIHHPDVRRMMMTMKCKVEAMRALAYTWAAAFDNSTRHADQAECERQRQVMELLAPIVKGWCTETGKLFWHVNPILNPKMPIMIWRPLAIPRK